MTGTPASHGEPRTRVDIEPNTNVVVLATAVAAAANVALANAALCREPRKPD
jgi:hypothetical protein